MLSFLIRNAISKPRVGALVSPKCSFRPSLAKSTLEHMQKNCFSSLKDNATSSEIVVYSHESKKLFRMMSIFGILQTTFWYNLASLSFTPMDNISTNTSYVLDLQSRHKYKVAAGSFILGGIILFFSIAFPLRSISKITLLKSRDAASISTYSLFGMQRNFVTSLNNISCDRSRASKGQHLTMKIKGTKLYFLLDKKNGVFHDPKSFDYIVGLKRIF